MLSQVNGRMVTLADARISGYSLSRELEFLHMTDPPAPVTKAQRFREVVVPLLEQAGYAGYGWQARLSRETGIGDSTISRMVSAKAIPEFEVLPALAEACRITLTELLARTELFPRESLQPLSGTNPSQVRSEPVTPEEIADMVGLRDGVGRAMLAATIERLKRLEDEDAAGQDDEHGRGAAAQM